MLPLFVCWDVEYIKVWEEDMNIKLNWAKYDDFTGILYKKKNSLFQTNITFVYLKNEEKRIKVKFGHAGAMLLNIGEKFTIGHIGKKVINIYNSDNPVCEK